ncbi:MAG: ADP-ribosylglycohydrolase family protein [Bryobacteraceae bacterium]
MQRRDFLKLTAGGPLLAQDRPRHIVEIPADVLEDKIRGGFLGQVIGDLNGLRHEMKYIAEPGNVQDYQPALPDGAWTDDDTDVEWPYILEAEQTGNLLIPYPRIAELWKKHINRQIWCSHLYLRQLLDLGIEPPLTGRTELNPWADFNLSGQFVSESWGLISPGMPQTAARIGAYYTHVSVEGEPVQSTQMMDAMIATAFLTGNMEQILDAGDAAVDPRSIMSQILRDVRNWHKQHPHDWRVTRKLTKDKYCRYGGQDMRDRNGVWLNGASTISALLYGDGDFVQTVKSAFNFGWDADNNAAAAGTIVGVIRGYKGLMAQGWNIKDQYRNTSRDDLPMDETITRYSDRLIALARLNIKRQGGSAVNSNGRTLYRITVEAPANVEPLTDRVRERATLRMTLEAQIDRGIGGGGTSQEKARAGYLAICLGLAPELKAKYPKQWPEAVRALMDYPGMLRVLFFEAPLPAGERIRKNALAAGVQAPARNIKQ